MPRAHDPRGVSADRLPTRGMGGRIPDFGQYQDWDDPLGRFIENLLQQIKDVTGIDLFWMLDWSWTTNTLMELVRQANDLTSWLQNPIQRPPNLLSRPSFSSPSAIASAPDWSWDPVVSLGTVEGPYGVLRTDPQGSAKTVADGSQHSMLSNAVSDAAALTPGQILVCEVHVLVEDGFTADDDQAIRLELVPSRRGVLQDAVVLASCGVPEDEPENWIAAPVGSKAVFFDVDYTVPVEDSPDAVELRLVVGKSAGGNVPVRFDGARVAAAGGFLVVLADLFDAGRIYLTEVWEAITAWLDDVFDPANWTALKTDTDTAFDDFVRRIKRALHHADADIFHPPSTSDIIANALKGNPWFGWIFEMVDDWLQPVLVIGKSGTEFWETVWHALVAFAEEPFAEGAWATLMAAWNGAWDDFVDDILKAWDPDTSKTHEDYMRPGTATKAALRGNEWFGWIFDMVDEWLRPVLNIGKAVTDFGTDVWAAVEAFFANPIAEGAWPALVNALNDAWNDAVDAILKAWNPATTKTHADFISPADATEAVLKNNPVTGWLWGSTYSGGGWLSAALSPITAFFDSIRKYINQMIEPLGWGYFDSDWLWVVARDTPDTEMPGSDPVLTPGSNDGDGGQISPGADSTIPAAPKNVSAIPFWDITVSGFPAGNITYAIAAVKSGVEGPATQVKIFVGTLFPPNSATHVDLRWDAVSGASSYKVYRKADGYSTTTAWRLVASPSSNGTLLSPVVDNVARSSGSVAAPKTDAELAASIVTSVKSTATTAASTASSAASTATAAATVASDAQSAADTASSAATVAIAKAVAVPEASIVINTADPESEDFGVTYIGVDDIPVINIPLTGWAYNRPSPATQARTKWTYVVDEGAKELYIGAAYLLKNIGGGNKPGFVDIVPGNADVTATQISYTSAGAELRTVTYRVAIPTSYKADDEIDFYIQTRDPYSGDAWPVRTIDAWAIAVGGTTSGDFEINTPSLSEVNAPDDSLVILTAYQRGTSSASAAVSTTGSVLRLSSENVASTDPTAYMTTKVATLNVDDGATIPVTRTVGNQGYNIVVKSLPRPVSMSVGSFASLDRTSGSTYSVSSTPTAVSAFDHVVRLSEDIDASVSPYSQFTVSLVGTYAIRVMMLWGGAMPAATIILTVNGDEVDRSFGTTTGVDALFLQYLKIGDVVGFKLVAASSGSATVTGVASMSLVNRSLL